MAITSADSLIAAITDQAKAYHRHSWKAAVAVKNTSVPQSMWLSNGTPGAPSTPPSSPTAPTSSTSGAIAMNNASGSNLQYLAGLSASGAGTTILYDRLFHISGLSGTIATAQNVDPTPSAPVVRGYGATGWNGNLGDDVEIWIEWYTPTGGSAANVTASYTNQAGTSGQTTPSVAFQQTPIAGQMQQLPLKAGDTGVRSVQTVTLSVSTGTAGNFGVTLVRKLAELPVFAAQGTDQDYVGCGMARIPDSACLALMVLPGNAVANDQHCSLTFCQG